MVRRHLGQSWFKVVWIRRHERSAVALSSWELGEVRLVWSSQLRIFPEHHFLPPRSLILLLNPTALSSNPAWTSPPAVNITLSFVWPLNLEHISTAVLCTLFHNLSVDVPVPSTSPWDPRQSIMPTGLPQRRCPENTHDFELNWKLVGALRSFTMGSVQAYFLWQPFLKQIFFFYCWKLTKLYLLDKGQMTLALPVNVRAVISHILKLTYFIPTHSKTTRNCLGKLFFLIFSKLAVRGCIQMWGKWILSPAIVPALPPPPDSNSHLWEHPPSLSSPAT